MVVQSKWGLKTALKTRALILPDIVNGICIPSNLLNSPINQKLLIQTCKIDGILFLLLLG